MIGIIRQRSKGTRQLRYDMFNAEPGGRRYVTETVRGNKEEAESVLKKSPKGAKYAQQT